MDPAKSGIQSSNQPMAKIRENHHHHHNCSHGKVSSIDDDIEAVFTHEQIRIIKDRAEECKMTWFETNQLIAALGLGRDDAKRLSKLDFIYSLWVIEQLTNDADNSDDTNADDDPMSEESVLKRRYPTRRYAVGDFVFVDTVTRQVKIDTWSKTNEWGERYDSLLAAITQELTNESLKSKKQVNANQ